MDQNCPTLNIHELIKNIGENSVFCKIDLKKRYGKSLSLTLPNPLLHSQRLQDNIISLLSRLLDSGLKGDPGVFIHMSSWWQFVPYSEHFRSLNETFLNLGVSPISNLKKRNSVKRKIAIKTKFIEIQKVVKRELIEKLKIKCKNESDKTKSRSLVYYQNLGAGKKYIQNFKFQNDWLKQLKN